MFVKSDTKGIHLHFLHWQFFIFIFLPIIILLTIGGLVLYKYYKNNYFDSSSNGSEIKEVKQSTIPPDVNQALQKGEKLNQVSFGKIIQNAAVTPVPSIQQYAPPARVHVPILMYHYVEYVKDKNDKTRISLNTPPNILEQQISALSSAGYTFMTNEELVNVFDGKANLPPKPILLTFDDGYRDFYTDAYPILKKYHVKATQYVIAGFLNRSNHLLSSQLQEIANDGLVEIGAHTVHHAWLKGRSLKNVSDEVFQSKEILQQLIHKPVVSFAYPFGAFDLQAIKVVYDAGFRSAASTIPGIEQTQDNRFFLYRLRSGGRTGKNLLSFLDQSKF